MANFNITKRVIGGKISDQDNITSFLKEKLKIHCKYKVQEESQGKLIIVGAVKESLFTPMTKFESTFTLDINEDSGRVNVVGTSGPNWVFWVFFVIGLFLAGSFTIIGIFLFMVQRHKPEETLKGIMNELKYEFEYKDTSPIAMNKQPAETISQLERLAKLRSENILTDKEFDEQKKRLLAS